MSVCLLPNIVSMLHIIRLVKRIVDASDQHQSPGEHRQHLIRDQTVAVVRFASSEGVDCVYLVAASSAMSIKGYSQFAILSASTDCLQ